MTQDSSDSSDSSAKPAGKPKARRSDGVAAILGKDMPKLECAEWDYRWISSQSEWAVVTGYELGREVIRQANYILHWDYPVAPGSSAGAELHPAWAWFVSAGKLKELMEAAGRPGMDESNLARALSLVVSSCPDGSSLISLPPSALKCRDWIRARSKIKQPKQGLRFQPQVEGEWQPDCEEDIPPSDRFDLLVWGDMDIPYPCHQVIIHIPMLQPLTRRQAQAEFAKWVAKSGYFVGPGRSQVPALLQLAFYRFNQGRAGLNQAGEFAVQFEPRNAKKGSVNAESADFGDELYRPMVRRTYGGANVLWSRSLKATSERLTPLADRLAWMVNYHYQHRPKTPWTGKIRRADDRDR